MTAARNLRLGTHGSDDAMRDEMCKILSSIAEAMAAAAPAKPTLPPAAKSPQPAPVAKVAPETQKAAPATGVEERLRQLEALFKKGLITEAEYKTKRAQILSSI